MYSLSEVQSKRLNIVKMLFAFFVVFSHCNLSNIHFDDSNIETVAIETFEFVRYLFSGLLPEAAVPGFFLMSSIFLYKKDFDWAENVKKKTRSLLVPYLFMNSFWIVIFAFFQMIPQTQVFFGDPSSYISNYSVSGWLHAYGIGAEFPFLYPLWFVRNLFVLNLLAKWMKKVIDKMPGVILTVLILFYFFCDQYFMTISISMWCFGYYIVKYNCDLNFFDDKKSVPIIFIIISCLCIREKNSVIALPLLRLQMLISLAFWYGCFSRDVNGLLQRNLLKYSEYNFSIYLFHEMFLSFLIKTLAIVLGGWLVPWIVSYFLLPFVICCFSVFMSIFSQKCFPKVFGLIMGPRFQQKTKNST